MTQGIRSPWAPRPVAPEDPLAGARKGRLGVPFVGRAYTLFVTLPFQIDDERAQGLAARSLGECLVVLGTQVPEILGPALARQKLTVNDRPDPPAIDLPLPEATVWGVASSTDPSLARAMLVDRLCLALSEVRTSNATGRGILDAHYISIVRTA